jgi:hypothetical protein
VNPANVWGFLFGLQALTLDRKNNQTVESKAPHGPTGSRVP